MASYNREKEIEKCFKENPDLIGKRVKEIALFFLIQGELRQSHVVKLATSRADLYRQRLTELSEEAYLSVKEELRCAGIE